MSPKDTFGLGVPADQAKTATATGASMAINSNSNDGTNQQPIIQKRKRVTRACDECRKKKVKCDGQQPCIHCTVYSYDCTYDQPTNRKKTGADLHLIESKLRAAEQVLQLLLPGVDVFDASFQFEVLEKKFNDLRTSDGTLNLSTVAEEYLKEAPASVKSDPDLGSPPNSGWKSTLSGTTADSNSRPSKKQRILIPHSNIDGSIESRDGREIKIILPPKNVALELVTKTWASPCVLFRFYHRPSFISDLDDLYETDPENYTNKQNRFLPLAYSVMAVGALFSKRNGVDDKFLEDEGYRYFIAARKLIDITDARDLYAIQTIVMLTLFLQCSAKLTTCYSYIGVALRSALKEGMHRKIENGFNPIELETRKRLFWTIYKMDIYVNTILGLPRSIDPEDIEQDLPLELDDDKITEQGYLEQTQGKLSSAAIANSHTKLILVLNNIAKNLYAINNDLRLTSHEKVSEMELQLREWLSNLPKELIPGFDPPFQYYKANRLLHLSFLHVQIVLYRPFIHYISPKYTAQPHVDALSIQRAKNCISVARTVVKLAQDMIKKNMLSGSYWFSIYTIFFSVACLVYYVHEVPPDEFHPDYDNIRSDAEAGKEILTLLKDSSMAASRIYTILNSLFEKLNRKTQYLQQQRELEKQRHSQEQGGQMYSTVTSQGDIPTSQNLMPGSQIQPNTATYQFSSDNGANQTQVQQQQQQQSQPQQQEQFNNIKLEEGLNDFDHLANFDNFINQPIANNGDNGTANATDVPTNPPENSYMPGMIDQLDMQIFGRFLPPYMLKRPDGSVGPGANGGDLPSGLQTTPLPTNFDDLPMNNSTEFKQELDSSWSTLGTTDFSNFMK
ncbi:ASG1 [Cyberlindnera jadinii]|uniref:ASG1 protein n=1 Tax=Cyberlindnera jadinii (strain ATCC 18201 / CBS 1600 / BCRC 20928 / JCM 3617 / NBRC 0987 / NRRL Y-1542) TaxID=983966 RepID=A0A0H5C008_CYBJN|nr:ASG1 [Cyberlindnera jadinii]